MLGCPSGGILRRSRSPRRGIGELRDIRPGDLGDLSHRVDERDLRREEGVRGDLDELGCREVGHDEGDTGRDDVGIHPAQRRVRDVRTVRLRRKAENQAIGREGILDGPSLAQELGVPRQHGPRAGVGDGSGKLRSGTHRDGGFAHDDLPRPRVREQRLESAVHECHVGGIAALQLWRSHGQEVHVGVARRGHVGRECETPPVDVFAQEVGEARLEERRHTACECRDLVLIDVDTHDGVPELRHRRGVHRPQVAAANHRYAHVSSSPPHMLPSWFTQPKALYLPGRLRMPHRA